jgi:hypothetical protein
VARRGFCAGLEGPWGLGQLDQVAGHGLFFHPDQHAQLKNNLPAYTVGSLRAQVQVECVVTAIRELLAAEDPQTQLQRFTNAVDEVFTLEQSKKHLVQRQLRRLAPTPSLKYRASEVMRNMPVLSIWKNLKIENTTKIIFCFKSFSGHIYRCTPLKSV